MNIKCPINLKLTILDNNKILKIEHFQNIIDISEKIIKIDQMTIYGNILKISKIENGCLEIYGEINKIEF